MHDISSLSEALIVIQFSNDNIILLISQNYSFLQTLDDHSSSITSVRFVLSHGLFQMVSCGADKSLIFRQLQQVVSVFLHIFLAPIVTDKTSGKKENIETHYLMLLFLSLFFSCRRMAIVKYSFLVATISSARQLSTTWNRIRVRNTF